MPTELPPSPPDTPVAKRTHDKDLTVTGGAERGPGRGSPSSDIPHSPIYGLLSIPLEVFTQIVSSLGPGDLLALARTCKSLRAFLMSKSRITMWQLAERNTPRLPPCPANMSQPQYAALAFTNECSFCGGYTNLKVEPKLRVRLCEPCRASELVEVFSFKANEDLDLIRHLSLTLRGPTVSSKGTGDGGLPRSSGHNALCLRRDLQNFCDTRERFLRSGDENGLKRWERELSDLVGVHDQFAEMLQRFLLYPELTPMQKAWQKAGERVDRIPNVDESVFFNNYDTDVEGQVSDEDDEDTEQDDTDRRYFFHAQLQRVKPLAHPFRTVLEALGVKIDPLHAVFGPGPSTPRPSKEIEDYPFPTTATVLSWPCLSTFRELKSFQISNYFWDELGHIVHHVEAWRENGEQELVEWWKSGMEPTAELANPIVKVRRSTAATSSLLPNLRFLLRADTIFSCQGPGAPGGQGAHLHYPHFYQNPNDCPCHGFPRSMNSIRMYRHLEAERITKVLLRDLGIPDIAYIQLLLMGASLVCGRCGDYQPRTWDQIIDHYREASQMWTGFQSRTPEFKTRHPLKFVDVHDLYSVSAPKPFVRRLTKEEVTSLTKSPPLDVHKGFCCILCRNYGVRHVFKNLVSIWAHMNDVHGIVNPVVGLHYASGALGASFSSWGQKWRDSWDSHQAAREWDL